MSKREPPALPRPEVIGDLLLRAAESLRTLHLFVTSEDEDGAEKPVYVLDVIHQSGKRAGATHHCLADALSAVLDCRELGRKCRACEQVKPVFAFSRSKTANTKDGRLPRCKVCERVRVSKYRKVSCYRQTGSAMQPHQLN